MQLATEVVIRELSFVARNYKVAGLALSWKRKTPETLWVF